MITKQASCTAMHQCHTSCMLSCTGHYLGPQAPWLCYPSCHHAMMEYYAEGCGADLPWLASSVKDVSAVWVAPQVPQLTLLKREVEFGRSHKRNMASTTIQAVTHSYSYPLIHHLVGTAGHGPCSAPGRYVFSKMRRQSHLSSSKVIRTI